MMMQQPQPPPSPPPSQLQLTDLPDELLCNIAQYISYTELSTTACVSHRWRDVVVDPGSFHTMYNLKPHHMQRLQGRMSCVRSLSLERLDDPEEVIKQVEDEATGLERLSLRGMTLSRVPTATCGVKLRELSLEGCRTVTDQTLIEATEKCPNLIALDLSLCLMVTTRGFITVVSQLPNLQSFVARACRGVNDTVIDALTALNHAHLSTVLLTACSSVTSVGVGHLARCRELRHLSLSSCRNFDDKSLISVFAGASKLRSLWLGHSMISDEVLFAMAGMLGDLKYLDITKCDQLTNAGIRALAGGRACLHGLNVYYCRFGDDGLLPLRSKLGEMKHLDLTRSDCSSQGLAQLMNETKGLQSLVLSYCYEVENAALRSISMQCPRLRKLNLSMCRRVTGAGMMYVSTLPLEELILSYCSVTDDDLAYLTGTMHLTTTSQAYGSHPLHTAKAASTLKVVNLYQCMDIGDRGVMFLSKCHKLEQLVLAGCHRVTDAGALALTACPELRILKRSGTQITDELMMILATCSPHLEYAPPNNGMILGRQHHHHQQHQHGKCVII